MRVQGKITCAWGLLVLLSGVPGAAIGADAAGRYRMVGIGSQSCAKFMQVVRQRDVTVETVEYKSWLEGYLTAVNTYFRDVYDIGGQRPISHFLLALDQACQSKAEERIATVVERLILQLSHNRPPTPP